MLNLLRRLLRCDDEYIASLEEKLATLSDLANNYRMVKENQNRSNLVILAAIVLKAGGRIALSQEFTECVNNNPNLVVKSIIDKETGDLIVELTQGEISE